MSEPTDVPIEIELATNDLVSRMEDLRMEIRRERRERKFLWVPIILISAGIILVGSAVINNQADNARQDREQRLQDIELCESGNRTREVINQTLEALLVDADPAQAAHLRERVATVLVPKDCHTLH